MAFVLDGTNNLLARCWTGNNVYTTFAAAMAAASAGDEIMISEGVLTEDITLSKSLNITGCGKGRTKIVGKINLNGYDNIRIRDMTVQNTDDAIVGLQGVDGILLDNLEIVGSVSSTYIGVKIMTTSVESNAIRIRNCEFIDFRYGIWIETTGTYAAKGMIVENCDFSKCYYDGIHAELINSDDDIHIEKCLFDGVGGVGVSNGGISLMIGHASSPPSATIRNSIIKNCQESGIYLSIPSAQYANVEITGNIITECKYGIYALLVTTVNATYKISGNSIYNSITNDLYAATAGVTINAEYNWWGTDSPVAGQFGGAGTVDYTPYLTNPLAIIYNSILQNSMTGDLSTIVAKLPTNYIMGSGVQSDKDDEIDSILTTVNDIETDTQDIQNRIPTALTGSGNIKASVEEKNASVGLSTQEGADVEAECDDAIAKVMTCTTNKITDARAGNLDNLDKAITASESDIRGTDGDDLKDISDEIAALNDPTAADIADAVWDEPKTGHTGDLKTMADESANINTKINTVEGKMPTNYVMGSSDQSDKDDEIDAIKADTDRLFDSAMGSITDGSFADELMNKDAGQTYDSTADSLEAISEALSALGIEVTVDVPDFYAITPYGANSLDGELAAGASTLTLDSATDFEASGYVKIDSEIIYYSGKSANDLTGLVRGQFGTSDVTHIDGSVVRQALPLKVTLTVKDQDEQLAPHSAPTIEAEDMNGTTKITSTNMTIEGGKVGVYYHDFVILQNEEAPMLWTFKFGVEAIAGKTLEFRKVMLLIHKPATTAELYGVQSGNLRVCTQDGYYDDTNTFHAWTDSYAGYVRDDAGNRIEGARVTFLNKINDQIEITQRPPAQTTTDVAGNWILYAPVGTYQVFFKKTQLIDVNVEREVT